MTKILYAPVGFIRPGKTASEKNYPWPEELAKLVVEQGHQLIQVGAVGEKRYADMFWQNPTWKKYKELIHDCDSFISVDTYMQHLAWYLAKPGVVIFSQTDPKIYGHDIHVNLLKDRKYLRQGWKQFAPYDGVECNNEAFVAPTEVLVALRKLLDGQKEKT